MLALGPGAGQDGTCLRLQDGDDVNGANVGFVLVALVRRQAAFGIPVCKLVNPCLRDWIGAKIDKLLSRLRRQDAAHGVKEPVKNFYRVGKILHTSSIR